MKKLIKYTIISFFTVTLFIVIIFYVGITQIDPNRFKPVLVDQARKLTNLNVVIDGNLSWKFFPDFAIKVGHSSIHEISNSKQKMLIEINNTDITIKLLPLLHRKLEIVGFDMTGIKISLNGETPKPYYLIKNAEIHSKNIKTITEVPLSIKCDLQPQNNAAFAHIDLNTDAQFNMSKHLYAFQDTQVTGIITQKTKRIAVKVQGNIDINTDKQTLTWKYLQGNIANIPITATLNITHLFEKPIATGHITAKPFDLKQTITELGLNNEQIQLAKNAKGDFDYSFVNNAFNMNGRVWISKLTINHAQMTNVDTQLHYAGNILNLDPFTADFYDGHLQSQIKFDFYQSSNKLAANVRMKNISADKLLHDITQNKSTLILIGDGNVDFQINTYGIEGNSLLNHLNGLGHFSFRQGSLQGIDINRLIQVAIAVLNRQELPSIYSNKTVFNKLNGTTLIRNGKLQCNDLVLDADSFVTYGQGNVNLINKQIDYVLQINIKKQAIDQKDSLNNLYGTAIPIIINGNLSNPSIRLDAASLLKSVAGKQVKQVHEKIKNRLQDEINKRLPGADLLQDLLQNN